MRPDCCRPDYDALFDDRLARRELAAYRRRGARGTTRRLVDGLRAQGIVGATVLDIGGGVGIVGSELLRAGARRLVDIDASAPYLAAARDEIARLGLADRATFLHGDFVGIAEEVDEADVVTLDRVLCCYTDWQLLVDRSVARARRLYGIVYPRDRWWMRVPIGLVRGVGRAFGRTFPFHVHPEREVDARIRAAGFTPVQARRGVAWQTIVYRRLLPATTG